jgi:hypothetical protein
MDDDGTTHKIVTRTTQARAFKFIATNFDSLKSHNRLTLPAFGY